MRLQGATDRGVGPWLLQLVCCGYDDGTERFATWEEADEFRESYCSLPGHQRSAILREALGDEK